MKTAFDGARWIGTLPVSLGHRLIIVSTTLPSSTMLQRKHEPTLRRLLDVNGTILKSLSITLSPALAARRRVLYPGRANPDTELRRVSSNPAWAMQIKISSTFAIVAT